MTKQFQKFEDLKGQRVTKIETRKDEEILFFCESGMVIKMHHFQDCCEIVRIEDIAGDLKDLEGCEIFMAEESSNKNFDGYEEQRWTFYKLASIKGYVTIR